MALKRIVSGAQTGVDRGALDAAIALGFACGGYCPAGRRAEDGRIPDRYPMTVLDTRDYPTRTVRNLLESDGTLILFHRRLDGGTRLTLDECKRHARPRLALDAAEKPVDESVAAALSFIATHRIETLNVAGPRASRWPDAAQYAFEVVAGIIRGARDGVDCRPVGPQLR